MGGRGAEAREGFEILCVCIKNPRAPSKTNTLTHASVLERKERGEGNGWGKERGGGKLNLTTGAFVSGSAMSSMSPPTVNSAPDREALWRPSKQYDVRHLHQCARPQQITCLDMGSKVKEQEIEPEFSAHVRFFSAESRGKNDCGPAGAVFQFRLPFCYVHICHVARAQRLNFLQPVHGRKNARARNRHTCV